ncbi:methyltransferase [Tenacibaculum sp. M341]|uniref:methyltransferase n=1 Tax=Tenacibaculum sp. M341 TaxID=2530339 RepID=UPI0010499474|nr:methyltransferase [Tenacibaculum sp. M341]TCI84680.1 methyltransferase domain-containing protein [Tenacibaculum sp. M341]
MDYKVEEVLGNYKLLRYPKTTNKSLRAWSNAELLVADYVKEKNSETVHVFNDRFGVWNCLLNEKRITTIWTYASQKKAITYNLELNKLDVEIEYKSPLDTLKEVDLALIKIPKSLELFELFLQQIHKSATSKIEVVCGFMTKYFSASYLEIAANYFEEVSQTKAWKKSRLLILKSPKKNEYKSLINEIEWKDTFLTQYYGVFSSGKIDIGTRFLLDNFKMKSNEIKVLDVASGNGIIAYDVLEQNKNAEVTLIDDFNLAIASSKLNVLSKKTKFVCDDTLDSLSEAYFDLVVSNPPFHFEHENNIEITFNLFEGVEKCLKVDGRFVLVANKHLNYKTYLLKLFKVVGIIAVNNKFVIYECLK